MLHFRIFAILASALALTACTTYDADRTEQPAREMQAGGGLDVLHNAVSIKPSLTTNTIIGDQTITARIDRTLTTHLTFPLTTHKITSAHLTGQVVTPLIGGGEMRIVLPDRSSGNNTDIVTLELTYTATPKRGYQMKDASLYTSYFACDWMVCRQEVLGDKATIDLEIILPRQMTTIGPGQLIRDHPLKTGGHSYVWHQTKATSSYLYAFAVGDFTIVEDRHATGQLRYMSAIANHQELQRLFAPTPKMVAFFAAKAGTPLRHPYTQLFVDGRAAQEASTHSLIGRQYLEPSLNDPQEDWLIAHELAHQWWGNSITCTDLSAFWLNEGVTVFMVAAWKEHRWGRDAYEREMAVAQKRYARAVDTEMDVPLSYKGQYPSLRIRRAIQYSKGALFLDALRTDLGDEVFWRGLKHYTKTNIDKTVTSADLQAAFETSSGQDLSGIFAQWVY